MEFNPLPGLIIALMPVLAAFIGMTRELVKSHKRQKEVR